MQISVQNTRNEAQHTLTLRLADDGEECPTCLNVPPEWYVDSATEEAMDPASSAIGGASSCTSCLNALITNGDVEITGLDTRSF